jgi:hypothetical protein
MLVLPGGADTVDHLCGGEPAGESCRRVHKKTLGVSTDSFDCVSEDVENSFRPAARGLNWLLQRVLD